MLPSSPVAFPRLTTIKPQTHITRPTFGMSQTNTGWMSEIALIHGAIKKTDAELLVHIFENYGIEPQNVSGVTEKFLGESDPDAIKQLKKAFTRLKNLGFIEQGNDSLYRLTSRGRTQAEELAAVC